MMLPMRVLADEAKVAGLVADLASSIEARMTGGDWALVGVRSRGDVLAGRLADRLGRDRFAGRVGTLDITLYRDDLSEVAAQPVVRTTDIPFAVDGLDLVLVDDVLMTGRSVRAALQQIMDLGRPRRVWLAVLVDRGGRELPIAADHVALDLTRDGSVDEHAHIQVQLKPTDGRDAIVVRTRTPEDAPDNAPENTAP
jgi:pyrimidine operon attenuation protein/uracil phosphoribosyltransferase